MADEPQGQVVDTATEQPDGTENVDEQSKEDELDLDAILARDDVKQAMDSHADKRVTAAGEKFKVSAAKDAAKAAEKARKDAEEAQLLKDGDLEKIAENARDGEAKAKAALEEYERKDKVNALLDKHEVTDPEQRKGWHRDSGDLAEMAEGIEAQKAMLLRLSKEMTNKALKTDPSEKPKDPTPEQPQGLDALAAAGAKSGDYADYMKAAGEDLDKRHKP